MGRFYNTAKPQFVRDNVYTPPIELMSKVITNTDLARDNYENFQASLMEKLKAEGLKADEPRVKEIINKYQSNIGEISKDILDGNLNFGTQMSKLRELGTDISNNWTMGEIAKIESNKKAFDEGVARDLERIKATKGYITEEDRDAVKSYNLSQFKGTDYRGPNEYNQLQYEQTAAYYDLNERLQDFGEGFKADGNEYSYDKEVGKWIKTTAHGVEEVKFDEVSKAMGKYLSADSERNAYNAQQVKIGKQSLEEIEAKERAAIEAYANKFSYKKESDSTALKTNDYWMKQWEWKHSKAATDEAAKRIAYVNGDASEIYKNSAATRDYERKQLYELTAKTNNPLTGKPFQFKSVDEAIEFLEKYQSKNPKVLGPKLQALKKVRENTKEAMRFSYQPLTEKYQMSHEKAEKFEKDLNQYYEANFDNITMRTPAFETVGKDGKREKKILMDEYQNFRPKAMIEKVRTAPNGQRVRIKKVIPGAGSVIPVFLNDEVINNDAHCVIKYQAVLLDEDGKDTEDVIEFDETAYFNMKKDAGMTLATDEY